jgi:DNA-directed RNA polymerase subunit RPC12/RpoP
MKNAGEADREICKQRLAQKLHEEEGLDSELCGETLELLAAVLFGEKQKKICCKSCGKELKEGAKFCGKCGAQAGAEQGEDSFVCAQCGAQLEADEVFCSNCGTKAGVVPQQPAPAQTRPSAQLAPVQTQRQVVGGGEVLEKSPFFLLTKDGIGGYGYLLLYHDRLEWKDMHPELKARDSEEWKPGGDGGGIHDFVIPFHVISLVKVSWLGSLIIQMDNTEKCEFTNFFGDESGNPVPNAKQEIKSFCDTINSVCNALW